MDINWQFNDPPNPADATLGPQGYDNHLYYSCVASIQHFCILIRIFRLGLGWVLISPTSVSCVLMVPQGVADPNPDAYLQSICSTFLAICPLHLELTPSSIDLRRVENDAAVGNSPLWFGEWALSTQFDASDDFLRDWADAQKLAYSKGQGWIVRRSLACVGVL